MMKYQELNILREMACKLGADSYLGPWLDSVANELQALILADIQPHVTLADAIANAREITDKAEHEAKLTIEAAKREATRIEERANKQWDELSTVLYEAARQTINKLNER